MKKIANNNSKTAGFFLCQEGFDKETIREIMAKTLMISNNKRTPEVLCALHSAIVYIYVNQCLSLEEIEIQIEKFKEPMMSLARDNMDIRKTN